MLKATLHSFLFMAIVISSVWLIDWYFGSPQVQTHTLQNTLITKAQAKPAPSIAPPTAEQLANHKSLLAEHTTVDYSTHYKILKTNLTLQFDALNLHLPIPEQEKLTTFLGQSDFNNHYQVSILSGPAPAENNTLLPQIAKLRAQTIARLIYPYTQQITMRYHPELSEGAAIVELIPISIPVEQEAGTL